jgi:hypothetical protein
MDLGVKLLKFNKRQNWVDHLLQQHHLTSTEQYNEKWIKKLEKKLPTNVKLLKQVDYKEQLQK